MTEAGRERSKTVSLDEWMTSDVARAAAARECFTSLVSKVTERDDRVLPVVDRVTGLLKAGGGGALGVAAVDGEGAGRPLLR
jgi:hypothetical protein